MCFGDATFSSFGGGGGGGEMRLVSMEAELEVREGTEESGGGAAAAAAESAGEGGADEIGDPSRANLDATISACLDNSLATTVCVRCDVTLPLFVSFDTIDVATRANERRELAGATVCFDWCSAAAADVEGPAPADMAVSIVVGVDAARGSGGAW